MLRDATVRTVLVLQVANQSLYACPLYNTVNRLAIECVAALDILCYTRACMWEWQVEIESGWLCVRGMRYYWRVCHPSTVVRDPLLQQLRLSFNALFPLGRIREWHTGCTAARINSVASTLLSHPLEPLGLSASLRSPMPRRLREAQHRTTLIRIIENVVSGNLFVSQLIW